MKALDNVSIDVVSGKVHGLIGANGAGKSTLIKILAGVYHPDEGQILIDGNEVKITDPATSTALGLSFIHQDLHLVEHFNVMQNMLMGEKKDTKLGLIDWKKSTQKIQKVLELVNFTKPLTTKAKDLSTGDQWLIAIAKALMHDGEFHIVGTLIGVLITTIAFNGLAILGIDTYAQYLFQGFIILFSVALSSVARKYAIK